jgi:hypothetical protein
MLPTQLQQRGPPMPVAALADQLRAAAEEVQLEDRQIIRRSLNRDFPFGRGHDVLVPVLAPSLASTECWREVPYLAYTSESGMGRILAAVWAAAGVEERREPTFSSHLATCLPQCAGRQRGCLVASEPGC